jgi:hypothetical protein
VLHPVIPSEASDLAHTGKIPRFARDDRKRKTQLRIR